MVFYAISRGVCYRLASLTSFNNQNVNMTVDEIYSIHAEAMVRAGLMKRHEFPILSQCIKKED